MKLDRPSNAFFARKVETNVSNSIAKVMRFRSEDDRTRTESGRIRQKLKLRGYCEPSLTTPCRSAAERMAFWILVCRAQILPHSKLKIASPTGARPPQTDAEVNARTCATDVDTRV